MGERHESSRPDGRDTIEFASFQLDFRAGRLTRNGAPIPLRPKTWAVLVYLAERPGVLISKEELLDAVWPDVAVTPDTLTKSIGELRLALGDDSKVPRYIETAHRRGFRFIAVASASPAPMALPEDKDLGSVEAGTVVVGRDAELQRLQRLLVNAHQGQRQLAFVTGAAGAGKTTLIEAFLTSDAVRGRAHDTWIVRGATVEQHGTREAYLPVLKALARLERSLAAPQLTALLRRVAPTWLIQMPWLLGDDGELVRELQGLAKTERMLREFAALTEALTAEHTIILVLEDLHWSDPSTIDLLSVLAQREETARLLIIGTYRPAEVAVSEHPLSAVAHMLKARRQCAELALHELTPADVESYLSRRFPESDFASVLAPVLYDHTDGNPLFMVAVADNLLARGLILDTSPGWALSTPLAQIELGIPHDVGRMCEAQIDLLAPADRELLEVASLSGAELAVPAIATVLGSDAEAIELRCEALARARRFLRASGRTEWPDGSVARRYAFTHELYRQVMYAGIPDRRRMTLHQRMGEALESAYRDRPSDVAPQLAMHFERSRDRARAIPYLIMAGVRARQRCANRETLAYLDASLAAAAQVRDDANSQRLELQARAVLGSALGDIYGYGSDEVCTNYERADELAGRIAAPAEQFEIVYALCHFHAVQANEEIHAMCERLDALADQIGTPAARLRADSAAVRLSMVGGRFAYADARMQRATWPDASQATSHRAEFGPDPAIDAKAHYALAAWFLGHTDRARDFASTSVQEAHASGSWFTQAAALTLAGVLEIFCANPEPALDFAHRAAQVCEQGGFAYWHAMASAVKGQSQVLSGAVQDGIAQLRDARDALQATGARVFSSHIRAFLADAYVRVGDLDQALAQIDDGIAIAESTQDRTFWPELWRLKGEIIWARETADASHTARKRRTSRHADGTEAERCCERALELARATHSRALELRAATSLARMWQSRGRPKDAHTLLAKACKSFPRDVRTVDIDAARLLMRAL